MNKFGLSLKKLAMWLLFAVDSYGTPLPDGRSEKNISLFVAVLVILLSLLIVSLFVFTIYALLKTWL